MIADSGASVAHCPTPFARYGQIMENFGDYLRAGVIMGLGTDTAPHNLVEEMRKAAILARLAARDIETVTTADVLHAATVGVRRHCCATISGGWRRAKRPISGSSI